MTWETILTERYAHLQGRIAQACARAGRAPSEVQLLAVTKTATRQQIAHAVRLGMRQLAENRVQVLERHVAELREDLGHQLPPDLSWHMIGHLQRNKVKQVLPLVAMVQSVDSIRLAEEIAATAQKLGRTVPILIEVNAGEEPQKHGFAPAEVMSAAASIAAMPGLELRGLMSMAPLTDDQQRIRATFAKTQQLLAEIRSRGIGTEACRELSMGMSGDFEIAIEHGATIVRIGSTLFSETA